MYTVLVVVLVLVSIALIALVLIQHGKGADAGAAFGSGASGTVFGSRGSANFLSRSTAWLAAAFFILSLAIAYLVQADKGGKSVVDSAAPVKAAAPAAPVLPAPGTATPALPPAAAPALPAPTAAPAPAPAPAAAPAAPATAP